MGGEGTPNPGDGIPLEGWRPFGLRHLPWKGTLRGRARLERFEYNGQANGAHTSSLAMSRTSIANTSISVASARDARALTALRAGVAQEMTRVHGEGHWSARPSRADVLRQLRASRVLVARHKDEIVGTVRLAQVLPGIIESSAFTPVESALYVLGLAVSPARRGLGIGRALMEAAKDAARAARAQALWLDAYRHPAGAGPFYLKCGFRRVGETRNRELPLVYFEWLASADSSPSSGT
jgi:GNAT superfamily N-acetyltransferase